MIYLYSGTPGSGKSLHVANEIYYKLKFGNQMILCNFPINLDYFKERQHKRFRCLDKKEINPDFLIKFAEDYWKAYPKTSIRQIEGHLKIYLEEAQLYFNAREWQRNYKEGWTRFFSLHRHLGYDIILITQFDRMLDRQIRSLIEYEYIHRKVGNIGAGGKVFNTIAGGGLFYCVKVWYPQKEKVGGEFFKFHKKYDRLYDTHAMFDNASSSAAVTVQPGEGPG